MQNKSRLLIVVITILLVLAIVQSIYIFTKHDVTIHISKFNYNPKAKDNTAIRSGSSIYQNDMLDRTEFDDWVGNYERLAPDETEDNQFFYFGGVRYYTPTEGRFLELDQIPEMPDSLFGKNPLKDIDVNGFKKRFQ